MTKNNSEASRFWESVVRSGSGCLEWTKFIDKDGYGQFKIGSRKDGSRRMVRAHRWAYEQFVCDIPDGLQIDHLCRNRRCVNPEHLEPVTGLVNTRRGWRANKSECKYGHPLSGDNLYIQWGGGRGCRQCRRRLTREHYRKTSGAAQKSYAERNRDKRAAAARIYRAAKRDGRQQSV